MSTIKITGKVNSAICYAKVVEEEALDQIKRMCDSPMSEGSKIRIMPDVHSGKGCTIGTTMTISIEEETAHKVAWRVALGSDKQKLGDFAEYISHVTFIRKDML